MVESTRRLDMIFRSFADSTRRDILKRVCKSDLTITEIARPYGMSFAAIAKHVAVLEKGRLISKRRRGKEQVISANPGTMTLAAAHLQSYERAWKQRYDKLESLLSSRGE
jgi:DNA-binding transcriptional ArsR family regulator